MPPISGGADHGARRQCATRGTTVFTLVRRFGDRFFGGRLLGRWLLRHGLLGDRLFGGLFLGRRLLGGRFLRGRLLRRRRLGAVERQEIGGDVAGLVLDAHEVPQRTVRRGDGTVDDIDDRGFGNESDGFGVVAWGLAKPDVVAVGVGDARLPAKHEVCVRRGDAWLQHRCAKTEGKRHEQPKMGSSG